MLGPAVVVVARDLDIADEIAAVLEREQMPQRLRLDDPAEVQDTAEVIVLAFPANEPGALEQLRLLRERLGTVPLVLIIPDKTERRLVRSALRARVDGLLVDGQVPAALGPTIRAVLAGLTVVPRRERLMLTPALSHRERQVLGLVTLGYANSQVADRLFLSESTVKSHLTSAFAKLGVASRREAATLVLDPEEPLGRTVLSAIQPELELVEERVPWR